MSDVGPGSKIEQRYKLRSELARAGELRVFVASDAITGERFEAHVLDGDAPEEAMLAFSQEAEILSRVDDPAFLPVATVGALPGGDLYYIAAERSATRLSDCLGTLTEHQAARVATQLLSAVARLHAVGWFLGWMHPEHVDQSPSGDGFRIVRLSYARPSGRAAPAVDPTRDTYADPRLAEGTVLSVATDLGCVGRLVRALVAGEPQDNAFWHVVERLEGSGAVFESANEAAEAFQTLIALASAPWPSISPSSPRLRDTDTELIVPLTPPSALSSKRSSAEVVTPTPLAGADSMQVGTALEVRQSSGKRWAVAAVVAAAVIATVVVLAPDGESESGSDSPPTVAGAAVAPQGDAPPVAAPAQPHTKGSLDPIRAVAALNRTQLANVLPYSERHALLDRVAERPDLNARVDARWQTLLDLVQAGDSPTPCTTFRQALAGLDGNPPKPTELAVWRAIAPPTPETVLGAGRAPDGSCDGLEEAHAEIGAGAVEPVAETEEPVARSAQRRRARSRKASKAPAAAPAPAESSPVQAPKPEPKATRPGVTRLDDLKSVN